jgi:hypothetical protein
LTCRNSKNSDAFFSRFGSDESETFFRRSRKRRFPQEIFEPLPDPNKLKEYFSPPGSLDVLESVDT